MALREQETPFATWKIIQIILQIIGLKRNADTDTCSDVFHMTIEEYLHSLISLIEELARLAVNSVTLGDYHRPLEISQFVKDLHAGFQLLNLKNDTLRKRSDSIKYNVRRVVGREEFGLITLQVKKIEDVVYDLSLRNLLPQGTVKT